MTHLEFDDARDGNPPKVPVFRPNDAEANAERAEQRTFAELATRFRNGYDCFTFDCADPHTLEAQIHLAIAQRRDTAGRDACRVTMRHTYRNERNPVTGAEIDANATVLRKLRAEVAGTVCGVNWDKQPRLQRAAADDAGSHGWRTA